MIRTLVEVGTFYGVLLFLFGVSALWSVNEAFRRMGPFPDPDRAKIKATFYELLDEGNPIVHFYRVMYCITFFYYCIPVTFYQRIVKHNEQATIFDPKGRYSI